MEVFSELFAKRDPAAIYCLEKAFAAMLSKGREQVEVDRGEEIFVQ